MKLPKEWTENKIEAKAAKLEARINMSADVLGKGLCPECRRPMSASVIDGVDVLFCQGDRIAVPVANDVQPEPVTDPAPPVPSTLL